ncbi:MAG: hypothetical protein ACQEQL_08880 [Pseudomonadota bacterium]
MMLNSKKLLIFVGLLICFAGPALAGGGHHNITSMQDCYPVEGESAKTRPEYTSKPYARCLAKKREAQKAAQREAKDADTEDSQTAEKAVEPRKYFRIIKDEKVEE